MANARGRNETGPEMAYDRAFVVGFGRISDESRNSLVDRELELTEILHTPIVRARGIEARHERDLRDQGVKMMIYRG